MSELRAIAPTSRRTDFARAYLAELKRCLDSLCLEDLAEVIRHLENVYRTGKQVFIIGNGGSAATASHMACDLGKNTLPPNASRPVKRFRVMSLTDNTAWMSALANDLGYESVFAEPLRNLVGAGDVVIAISGSGNSPNIIEAIRVAKELGATTVGILGFDGGKARSMVDAHVVVETDDYGRIEDVHMALDHVITAWFREKAAGGSLQ